MSRLPASVAPGINDEGEDRPAASQVLPRTAPPGDVEQARLGSFPSAAPGAPPSTRPSAAPPTTPLDGAVNAPDALQPGELGGGVRILSEEDVMKDILKDDLRLPIAALGIGLVSAMIITGGIAWADGGALGAAMGAVFVIVITAFRTLINTPAAWLTSKLFNADFGNFGSLTLRVAAVCSGQALVGALLPGVFSVVLGFPLFLLLAVWLIGIDFFQAFVLAVVSTIANMVLLMFVFGSLFVMMAS